MEIAVAKCHMVLSGHKSTNVFCSAINKMCRLRKGQSLTVMALIRSVRGFEACSLLHT